MTPRHADRADERRHDRAEPWPTAATVAVTELDNALAGPRDVPEVAELHERVWDARTPPQ